MGWYNKRVSSKKSESSVEVVQLESLAMSENYKLGGRDSVESNFRRAFPVEMRAMEEVV